MPSPFSTNPLFRLASAAVQRQARAGFRGTAFYELLEAVERAPAGGRDARLGRALEKYRRLGPAAALRQLHNAPIGRLARDVQRYARGGDRVTKELLGSFLESLGPVGRLLQAVALGQGRGRSPVDDVGRAIDLIRSFGGEAIFPRASRAATTGDVERGLEAAIQRVLQEGYLVVKPGEPPQRRPGILPQAATPSRRGNTAEIALESGGTKRLPINHPLITGDMIPVPSSSNVHSFGYDLDETLLYVRFYEPAKGDEKRTRPGPLYQYRHFPPGLFLKMMATRSKGSFIWDNIRVRGTVSGHRFDYALVGITGGYVPRKAVYLGQGQEAYLRRTVRSDKNRFLRSSRPDELVNRGLPNRGGPNTGAP